MGAAEQSAGLVGQTIDRRYLVDKVIGQGGFGTVYGATHVHTRDRLAVKVLRAAVVDDPTVVERFRREATLSSQLKHPNTVSVIDFGELPDGQLYLVMPFLEGRTLGDLLVDESPVAPERLVRIMVQVLKSLDEAHSKGLVHRDLKPDNIFLQALHGEPEFVRVLDFGIARSLENNEQSLTRTGTVMGTPKYMAPEQATGRKADARADIYAIGVVLFEALSGLTPLLGETPMATIFRRATEDAPRVHDALMLPVPRGLCDAVFRAMARDPDARFQTASEMAEALEAGLATAVSLPATVGAGTQAQPRVATRQYGGDGDTEALDLSSSEGRAAAAQQSAQVITRANPRASTASLGAAASQAGSAALDGDAETAPVPGPRTVAKAAQQAVRRPLRAPGVALTPPPAPPPSARPAPPPSARPAPPPEPPAAPSAAASPGASATALDAPDGADSSALASGRPSPPRSRAGLWVALVVALLALGGGAAWWLLFGGASAGSDPARPATGQGGDPAVAAPSQADPASADPSHGSAATAPPSGGAARAAEAAGSGAGDESGVAPAPAGPGEAPAGGERGEVAPPDSPDTAASGPDGGSDASGDADAPTSASEVTPTPKAAAKPAAIPAAEPAAKPAKKRAARPRSRRPRSRRPSSRPSSGRVGRPGR